MTGSYNEPQTTYKSPYFIDAYLFPWNPDKLVQGNTYKIYDDMKDDDQVKAAISFKKDMVVNAGWQIVCEQEEVKEFVEKTFNENLEIDQTGKSFDDVLRDMLSSYEYGFSLSEPVYELGSDNLYRYKTIKVRPPHSFRFKLDRFGNIEEIIQATDREELKLNPNLFLHHVYQQEFGNPYGKSDLKAAHPAWIAKKFFLRFFNIYVERFASPTVVGKYESTMDTNEVQRFNTVLKTMQNATTLAIPKDVLVDFVQNARDSSDTYVKGMDMFNLWISRAILVPDLLGISGEKTQGGSYSLGQTQFKMFMNTIEKDRKSLARKITLKLVRPLVAMNFGADIDCTFEFMPITQDNELEYSKVWSDFVKSRIITPSEEEINHFRRSVKFPESPVVIETPEQNDTEDENKENDQQPDGENAPPEKEEKPVENKTPKKEETPPEPKNFRELNQYEKVVNFSQIEKTLDSFEAKITPKLKSAGKAIIVDFLDQVKTSGIIKNFRPELLNNIQPRYLRDMNIVFKNYFIELFMNAYNEAQKEIFPTAMKKFSDSELLPEEFIAIVEAESFKNVGDYSVEITKKAKNILVQGIKNGLGEAKIVREMKDVMDEASERWLKTVIRTKTTEMFNSARKSYWETDEVAKDLVEAYEFSAIIDDRTSDVCSELDGRIFEKGDFIDRVTPPLHFNCRSLLVPITKFQDYKADSEPSIEKLQKLGGNLIFQELKEPQTKQSKPPVQDQPTDSILRISGQCIGYGDKVIIEPVPGKRIKILSIFDSNSDLDFPASVAYRQMNDGEQQFAINYKHVLGARGGTWDKDFSTKNWILDKDKGFMIHVEMLATKPTTIEYTIEYQVVGD